MADLEKTRKNLENRGFLAHVFATGAEAADYLAQMLHNTSIGIGGSVTIDEIGVYGRLSADNDVIWRWKKPTPDSRERGAAAETFLCSANGVSETGEIVNIDGYGNRVAPTIYGPQRVFLVVGRNRSRPISPARSTGRATSPRRSMPAVWGSKRRARSASRVATTAAARIAYAAP